MAVVSGRPARPLSRGRPFFLRPALGAAGAAMLLGGCGLFASPATTLAPKSDFARISHSIFLQILWWDILIFLVVTVVLLTAIIRFRERDPAAIPRQVRGNARLELAWTVGPALVLTFIAFPTVGAIFRTQAPPVSGALRIRVVAHQWWWEFQYPDLGITTASDLHLPAGRPIMFELTSVDVIHSFWVPQLGGKRDTVPGQINRIVFTPTTAGQYPGRCAEFCGVSHANMLFTAVVESPEEFQAWVARQAAPPGPPPEAGLVGQGRGVFAASACMGCHTIAGLSGGMLGPDLTHFGSRKTIAGGILANTSENLGRWLRNPPAVKPGSLMPDLRLSDAQVSALVAYLTSLK